jgi:hypothetical protein
VTSRALTEAVYVLLALGLALTEVLARRDEEGLPTFAELVRGAMRSRSAQLGIVLAWWWLGWHFLLAT